MKNYKKIYLVLLSMAFLALGGLAMAQDKAPATPAPDTGDQGPPPEEYFDDNYYAPWGGNHPGGRHWRRGWGDDRDNGPGYGRHGSRGDYGHRGRGYDGPRYGKRHRGGPGFDDNFQPNPRPNLTEEQLAALEKIHTEHWAKIEPIMDQIRDNKLLYRALSNQQNAPVDEIKKTISELSRLRKELRTEMTALSDTLKEQGLPDYGPRHFGPGHPGPGHPG
ncbi:MAG: hypothetical protein LBF38_08585, partial [Deltaproteobacteria bacterium]|nr:hypothetical protein [Deltaproteobacteria bacterium]